MNILDLLITNLSKLPGIGKKSASRIAYYLLQADHSYVETLANSILEMKRNIKSCSICGNYTEQDPCDICTDPSREKNRICIVESPKDIGTIEATHVYHGKYHVLMGAISPIDGIGPGNLRIRELLERVKREPIEEVIIATNPTIEGETTAQYIAELLKKANVAVTRLALGIPVGGDLEYTDSLTLARALKNRNKI